MTRGIGFLRVTECLQMRITGADASFNALHLVADYGNILTISELAQKLAAGRALPTTEKNLLNIARISENQAKKNSRANRAARNRR